MESYTKCFRVIPSQNSDSHPYEVCAHMRLRKCGAYSVLKFAQQTRDLFQLLGASSASIGEHSPQSSNTVRALPPTPFYLSATSTVARSRFVNFDTASC